MTDNSTKRTGKSATLFAPWHERLVRKLFSWPVMAVLAVLLIGAGLANHYGRPWYHHHREKQYAGQAEQYLAQGDFRQAAFRARTVLSLNENNASAIRVLAELSDRAGSTNALYWRERVVQLVPALTNQLALLSTAIRVEPYPFPTATRALNAIAPADRESAEYQKLAGLLAVRLSQNQTAEAHFAENLRLEPDNPLNRLSLAVLQLQSTNPQVKLSARSTLETLVENPRVGILALRPLVSESFDRKDLAHAEALSRQVVTNDQANLRDSLFHLTILQARHSPDLPSFLSQTQTRAATNAWAADQLATWMNSSGHAREALDWLAELPPAVGEQGLLPVTRADAYAVLGKWAEQERYLKRAPWPGMEPFRFALLARVAGKLAKGTEDTLAWQNALALASASPGVLSKLANLTAVWGWRERTEQLLWLMAEKCPEETAAMTTLTRLCSEKQDTDGLWRLAKIARQRNPRDANAGNNCASLALLLNQDLPAAHKLAASIYAAGATNAYYATTYAFSLLKQGQAPEALEVLRKFNDDQLKEPSIALYYGIILVAAGQLTTAQPFLTRAGSGTLLREEQTLLALAKKGGPDLLAALTPTAKSGSAILPLAR